jgi:hypothetical protein
MKNNEQRVLEIRSHIATWRSSGLSQAMFCKQQGFVAKTFGTWIRKYENPSAKEIEQPRFIAITHNEKVETSTLTIHYPNGIKIICPTNMPEMQLRNLVHLLD